MKSKIQSVVSSWSQLFGFLIIGLVLSTADCRFNRAKAQEGEDDGVVVVGTKWCNREYYEATYGPDWHIYWALNFCWLYTEPAMVPNDDGQSPLDTPKPEPRRRVAVRGR